MVDPTPITAFKSPLGNLTPRDAVLIVTPESLTIGASASVDAADKATVQPAVLLASDDDALHRVCVLPRDVVIEYCRVDAVAPFAV